MTYCKGCHKSPEKCSCPKLDMEYCSLCTRGFPHVTPRQYSPLEVVEDARGFVDHLKCKDVKACAEYMSTVNWAKIAADCE